MLTTIAEVALVVFLLAMVAMAVGTAALIWKLVFGK